MTVTAYLGIDIGTTNVKALLLDEAGTELALGSAPTSWTNSAEGTHSSGEALLANVREAMAAALASTVDPVRVRGIGITGMGESGVLLDPRGAQMMPVIAWYDQRGAAEVSATPPDLAAKFVDRTGLFLDAQATVAKLAWFHRTVEPIRPGSRWLSVPEWIAHRLGAAQVSEPSLASRTGMYDIDEAAPCGELPAAFGLPTDLLPEGAYAGTSIGRVTDDLGLSAISDAALTVAGHDHPVAAVGVGCTEADDLFNSCGTADVLIRSVRAESLNAERRRPLVTEGVEIGRHVLPGMLALNAGARNGLTLRRVLDLVGVTDAGQRAALDATATTLTTTPEGLTVSGFSSHTNEVTITLRDGASPAALWLAAVRGGAAETARLLRAIESAVGPHARAIASGGWTRFATIRAAKEASIAGLTVRTTTEPGAHGAAYFARRAAESFTPAQKEDRS